LTGNINTFLKYGYRKGSSRGGDITITTKVSETFDKKLNTLKNNQISSFIEVAQKQTLDIEESLLLSLQTLLKNESTFRPYSIT
jgi:CRISPR-associated protein Csh1